MAIHSAHPGMKQADVGIAPHGRGIGRRQIFHDGGFGEALPVDRHAQVLEPNGLGVFVGQEADILGQPQRSGHLVGGVVIAGDDDDRNLLFPQTGQADARDTSPVL